MTGRAEIYSVGERRIVRIDKENCCYNSTNSHTIRIFNYHNHKVIK